MKRSANRLSRFYRRHKRSIVIWSVVAVSAVMVFRGIMQYPQITENYRRSARIERQTDEEHNRQAEVRDLREKVNTDEYIERIASEKLGLVKSNAKIFKDISEDE